MIRFIVQAKEILGCKKGMYWEQGEVRVCTGIAIKNMVHAVSLPFELKGRLATKEEILFDWKSVKLNRSVGRDTDKITKVRLNAENADNVVGKWMTDILKEYRTYFPFDRWPESVQMAASLLPLNELRLHIELIRAFKAFDWKRAAEYCQQGLEKGERRNAIVKGFQDSG